MVLAGNLILNPCGNRNSQTIESPGCGLTQPLNASETRFQSCPGGPQWVLSCAFGTPSGSNPWVLNLRTKRIPCDTISSDTIG